MLPILSRTFLIAIVSTCCFIIPAEYSLREACGADGTNPPSGNPNDYAGGNWVGTNADDHYTNNFGATVTGNIDMTQGGSDRVDNEGSVSGDIIGGSTNYNRITNSGDANDIFGSYNSSAGSSGGFNLINSSGTVDWNISGSYNEGAGSSGGSNSITNLGTVSSIYGTYNYGAGSSGGSNSITNTSTVLRNIYGSRNSGAGSSGGSNFITSSGSVNRTIYGSYNVSADSSGGSNSITNSGAAEEIMGSYNNGVNSVGGFNTIINTGVASTGIYGSYNNRFNSNGGSNTIINEYISAVLVGSLNDATDTSGGGNSITNSGFTSLIFGSANMTTDSYGGSSSITNLGMSMDICGSWNNGDNSSGGSNSIANSGYVIDIYGSYNAGSNSSGGSNTISNSGIVEGYIYGSLNGGANSSGGSNSITNSGTVDLDIFGSINAGANSSGGSNSITNRGTVIWDILGSLNDGDNSSGGSNTIINEGTVNVDIYGSVNQGANSSSAGNTIINSGTVLGDIWGSLNTGAGATGGDDTITNSGYVAGNIYGEDGNDTVILVGGSTLGGVADGGTGTDLLGFDNMGEVDGSLIDTKYINFENLGIFGGRTTLIGTWNIPTWNVTIYEGNLYVNGTLITNLVTINHTGLLGGSGTIFGNLINYGTISPGNSIGTLTVNGNVTFMKGSTYLVELARNGSADLLDVSGSVTLHGGTVRTALSRALYTNGRSWRIISADGGINGRFDSIRTNFHSRTLSLHLSYGSNTVSVVLKRKPFASLAATVNQGAIGATFDQLVSEAKGSMADLIVSMDFDMSLAQIQESLAAMNPEMYSAFRTAGLQSSATFDQATELRQVDRRLRKHFNQLNVVGESQQPENNWNLWARYIGHKTNHDSEGDLLGSILSESGLVAGIDRIVNDHFLAGLSLSSTSGDLDWDTIDHDGTMKGTHIGVYTSIDVNSFFIDASFGYSDFDNSGKRLISFKRFDGSVVSDFNSSLLQGRLTAGYDFSISSLSLSPIARLRYARLDVDGFTEKGGDFLNLNVDGAEMTSLTTSLGIRLASLFTINQWQLLPRAELSWQHEHDDDNPTVTASFVDYDSAPFTVSSLGPSSDNLLFNLSCSADYKKSFSFFFDYLAAFGDGFDSHLISLGLAWRF